MITDTEPHQNDCGGNEKTGMNGLTGCSESMYDSGENGESDTMPSDALKRLEAELRGEIWDQAFVAGWQAAMDAVRQLSPPDPRTPERDATPFLASPAQQISTSMPRGMTNMIVEEVLKSVAPRAVTPTQIIKLAQEHKGTTLKDSSVSRALRRLAERGVAEQVGETTTWRYTAK